MSDKSEAFLAAIIAELHGIRAALEAMAIANSPEPRMVKSLAEFKDFDWGGINAMVVGKDKDGPTIVEWSGFQWKRRSRDDYGADIFFTRPNGKTPDGKVRYLRLITFRGDMGKVKAVPEGTREALAEQTEKHNGNKPPVAVPVQKEAVAIPSEHVPVAITGQTSRQSQAEHKTSNPNKSPKPRYWSGDTIKAILQAKLADNGKAAAEMLNLSSLTPKDPDDIIVKWSMVFVQSVADGQSPMQAACLADTSLHIGGVK